MEKTPRVQEDWASAWNGVDPEDEFRPLARSPRRQKRTPGQIDARSHSSAPQPASDPRSQTVGLPSNKCDVAVSCPHSILDKRLECCADQLNPPPNSDIGPHQVSQAKVWHFSLAAWSQSGRLWILHEASVLTRGPCDGASSLVFSVAPQLLGRLLCPRR